MRTPSNIAYGLLILITACKGPEQIKEASSEAAIGGVSVVDEVYWLSQGLDTDGLNLTVRGWLISEEGNAYKLYNASWDTFEPTTKREIPSILLKFETPPSDYWLGQYANISGRVVTEVSSRGDRVVTLDAARIVSIKIKDGETIPYRKKQAPQGGSSDGDNPSN